MPLTEQQEDELEEARDSLSEELLAAFFAYQAVAGGEEDETEAGRDALKVTLVVLGIAVVRKMLRTYREANNLRLRESDADIAQRVAETVSENDNILSTLIEFRRSLREWSELPEEEQEGPHFTPNTAARTFANQMNSELVIGLADELKSEGIEATKTWATRQDRRVRPLHRRLNMKTIPFGQDFYRWPATGQRLAYPGDKRAPLSAIANCRCFLLLSIGS